MRSLATVRSIARSAVVLLAFTALGATVDGCSLLVDTAAAQCSSDADCTSRGGAFAGSTCGADGVCVLRCESNVACTNKNGGVPSVCVRSTGACAELLSPDCETILAEPGALERDDAVVVGLLLPETGAAAATSSSARAVELARRHVHLANAGLPGLHGGPSRPLVVLWCTESRDASRAARHLVHEVRVPAIVGPSSDDLVTKIATQITIPAGVLLISPTATSSTLTDLADGGLVWRTAPSDAVVAAAMAELVANKLEPEVRERSELEPKEKIRVAVIHRGDARASSVASTLFKLLRFNDGQGAASSEHYRRFDYGDPSKLPAAARAAGYRKIATDTVAFQPHVVITIGATEAVTEILADVEARWPTASRARPRHLLSDGLRVPELLTLIGRDDALRKRVLGVSADVPGANYETFKSAYATAFSNVAPDIQAARAYDATLLLAYASAAARGTSLSGALLNEGLKKTVPAPSAVAINAGFNEINQGFGAMLGAGIDYSGASGPLDFDPATGEAPAEVRAWCVRLNDGQHAFATAGLVGGAVDCP